MISLNCHLGQNQLGGSDKLSICCRLEENEDEEEEPDPNAKRGITYQVRSYTRTH